MLCLRTVWGETSFVCSMVVWSESRWPSSNQDSRRYNDRKIKWYVKGEKMETRKGGTKSLSSERSPDLSRRQDGRADRGAVQ